MRDELVNGQAARENSWYGSVVERDVEERMEGSDYGEVTARRNLCCERCMRRTTTETKGIKGEGGE